MVRTDIERIAANVVRYLCETQTMKTLRFLLALTIVLLLIPSSWSQNQVVPGVGADTEDAKVVLSRASEALQQVHTIRYFAERDMVGASATRYPSARGTVEIQKLKIEDGSFRLASEGTTIAAGSADAKAFHSAFDDEATYKVSPGTSSVQKKEVRGVASKDRLGVVTGSLGRANYDLLMLEVLSEDPLQRQRSAPKIDYEGRAAVSDVLCDVVYVEYPYVVGGGIAHERWYIGRKDHLPRRLETISIDDDGKFGADRITYSNLHVNVPIPLSAFRIRGGVESVVPNELKSASVLLPIGSDAPAWSLRDTAGKTVSSRELRGRYVVLDFWATWCAPCVRALPELEKLHNAHRNDDVRVFSVSSWEKSNAAAYVQKKGYTFSTLLAGDKVAQTYGATTLPTTYVLGPDGKVLYRGDSLSDAIKMLDMKHGLAK